MPKDIIKSHLATVENSIKIKFCDYKYYFLRGPTVECRQTSPNSMSIVQRKFSCDIFGCCQVDAGCEIKSFICHDSISMFRIFYNEIVPFSLFFLTQKRVTETKQKKEEISLYSNTNLLGSVWAKLQQQILFFLTFGHITKHRWAVCVVCYFMQPTVSYASKNHQ